MAESNELSFNIKIGGNQDQALGSLKAQLKEATQEVQALSDKFGATSEQAIEAAKRAAELKDQIGDAATLVDAFNPDTKFKAFSQTLGTVAGGFSAVQGALGLLGSKGEDVEKTLAKVQSALALSQGLEQLGDLGAAFTNLKGVAIDTFKGIKAAIGSTGIGVLVVALGAIVTYWDDIKAAVSGVSEEQKKLLTDTQADVKAQQEKLSAIDSQDNVLKLQGKSEKEILGLKIKQTDAVISATEKQVAQQKVVLQAQLAAEKRNKEILKGILTFVTAPLQLVIDGVNQVAKVFGKGFEFNVAEKLSGLVFDPKATEANGQKEIAALDKTLSDLKNKKAGFQLAVQNIDRQGASKSAGDAERIRKEREAAEKEAQTILAEANKKLKTQQEQDLLNITEAYAEKQKKLALAGIKDNGDLAAAEQKERQAVLDKYAKEAKDLKDKNDKEAKDKEIAFQTELNKITLETKLAGIKDEGEKARVELEANFKKQREDIDANEKFTAEQKTALKLELAKKEALALDALKLAEDKKIADSELAALDKRLADNEADLQIERSLLDQKDTLLKDAFAKKLITEEQYNAGVAANAKARTDIDKKEAETKVQLLQMTSQALTQAADILGKETAAGKTLAVAGALINTYQGIAAGVKLGFPLAIPAVAMAAATGFSAVKNILAVKTPGGSSGGAANISAPNVSAMAPMAPPQPQAQTTSLNTQTINALGNQAQRAYVVESDVTSSQQRIAAIQQRARFG
jgi:hypothetical protein